MSRLHTSNTVSLLCDGAAFFPALLTALDHAQHEIHLETSIFRMDGTGQRIAEALMAAAARGVRVCVLVDGFGSVDFPGDWLTRLRLAGVAFLFYRPERLRWWPQRSRLRRLHRKLVVVDARVAFIGGINLHDDRDNAGPSDAARYDYAVQLEGGVVADIYHAMKTVWQRVQWFQGGGWDVPRLVAKTASAGKQRARLVVRDNVRYRGAIEQAYLRQIQRARHHIVIASAYFLPGLRIRHALCAAAQRGVKVEILLQGRVDHAILHYATRMLYLDFLRSGIQLYEYQAGYMHAKVAVVDGVWATVGSSNIDPFSLLLAREANVVVLDSAFARQLGTHLANKIATTALPVQPSRLLRASLPARLVVWVSYGLVRAGISLTGYGGRFYQE